MTESIAATDTESGFPAPRGCPFHTEAPYRDLREERPISKVMLPSGREAWLLTRHEDVRAMLADPRFSADRRKPGFPLFVPGQNAFRRQAPSMITLDGAAHSAARRLVISEFSVKRVNALAPRIQQIVDRFVDELLAAPKPADLVQSLSLPVPSLVICELLGVPYADHDYFQSRTTRLIRRTISADERYRVVDEIRDYLAGLVTEKIANPPEDLLGRQIRRQLDEHGDTDLESLTSLAFLLLLAGHETTANMISLGVLALLTHPDQLAELQADPARTPLAVEELLRYFTIAEVVTSRIAETDVELGGVLIRAGEGVVGDALSANRDDRAFGDPEALDLDRGSRNHVAFGFGPHQCLGQNLARKELQIVFDTLFQRVPTLSLAADPEDLPYKDDATIYGVYQLPVTW
ncbi:MAG TPA: cytochrome P450 [Pseudonocardiaceae bacterium]|jgi:cytochrome P450|nr:cytochrome P450 [Pseudonocardiaceae bacterium]